MNEGEHAAADLGDAHLYATALDDNWNLGPIQCAHGLSPSSVRCSRADHLMPTSVLVERS
jgi:hypothetical protein